MTTQSTGTTRAAMDGRRIKSVLLLAGVVASGLTIIAWTQPWFDVTLVADEPGASTLSVAGDVAAGALAALGLAGLALVGALSIAGILIRIVLGVLEVLLGATVALSSILALSAPTIAAGPAISTATGVAGRDSLAALVSSIGATPWPAIATVLGVATVVVGVLIIMTARRWPGSPRKYRAVTLESDGSADGSADGADDGADLGAGDGGSAAGRRSARRDAVTDWDALSDGSDPTAR